jgi:hypothetical protein
MIPYKLCPKIQKCSNHIKSLFSGVPMLMDVKILLDKAEQHLGHALEGNKGAYWVGWAEVIILMLVIIPLNTG